MATLSGGQAVAAIIKPSVLHVIVSRKTGGYVLASVFQMKAIVETIQMPKRFWS